MNTNAKRVTIKAALFAAVLTATCFVARPANAQAGIQGKFTLPYETHWGKAVLPAGDYELKFASPDNSGMLVIRDAKNHQIVAFEPANIREDSTGESALLIGTRGTHRVVRSLRLAELGESFIYSRASARQVEEARQTKAVPVVVAKK